MMICPNCKKEIDLPFDVETCPHCGFDILNKGDSTNKILDDDIIITNNPFIESNTVYPRFSTGALYLEKYEIMEHLADIYPFTYYAVKYNEKKYVLQLATVSALDFSEIEKKLKKEFSDLSEINTGENIKIIEYGIKNTIVYFLTEYFSLETLEDLINTSEKLNEDFILNIISFLIKWYENIIKPHIFLSPSNIINLGNNQFKVINYTTLRVLANFIKPFYFFKEEVSDYFAPELLKGSRVITKKADIYSVGKIWNRLITAGFDIENYLECKNLKVKSFIDSMILENYNERNFKIEEIKSYISEYFDKKNAENFITQKISVKDIIIENNEKKETEEELIAISEDEIESINENEVVIEEIEPEIIISNPIPPKIPVVPPPANIKKITEREFKIAKKELIKNPIDRKYLKVLYDYYSEKQMLDEAFVISSLLHFIDSKNQPDGNLLFNSGKTVKWDYDKVILTSNNLQKILPRKIYFNASGVMEVLYELLQRDLPLIKTNPPLSNYSILINDKQKKEILDKIIKLSGIENIKVSLTNQNINNDNNLLTAIYKRDKDVYIVMKKDLCEEMKPYQFKVIMAKLVFMTHPSIVGNLLYDPDTIKDIFYGVMKFVVPSSRYMYNSKISNMVSKELERQKVSGKIKRNDIIRLVMLMNDHLYNRKSSPDIDESLRLIETASDRFALVVSNNLNETLKTILKYGNINIKLTPPERMKALLKYALSDDYFKLRKSIKQSIKA